MTQPGGATKSTQEQRVYTASEARRNFADLFDEAVSSGGKVMVTRRRKTVAIVDADWLERLEKRAAGNEADAAARARQDLDENGGKELTQFEEENGLLKS